MAKTKNKKIRKSIKKKEKIKVYFCPKCKSVDVGFVFGLRNLLGIIQKMECKNCHFSNQTFPLAVIDKDKLNSKNKLVKMSRK